MAVSLLRMVGALGCQDSVSVRAPGAPAGRFERLLFGGIGFDASDAAFDLAQFQEAIAAEAAQEQSVASDPLEVDLPPDPVSSEGHVTRSPADPPTGE